MNLIRLVKRPVETILGPVQRRLSTARPGSVLILVVTLLVLIALIGTAMISTARSDRYATIQSSVNTQADLLLDGVARMAKAELIKDLSERDRDAASPPAPMTAYEPFDFRPPKRNDKLPSSPNVDNDGTLPNANVDLERYYYHAYIDSAVTDRHLAARVPSGTRSQPYWSAVSSPLAGQAFESPIAGTGLSGSIDMRPRVKPITGTGPEPVDLQNRLRAFEPVQHTVRYANGTQVILPALRERREGYGAGDTIIAADADGDGVADAGLWRVPVGQLNGVTYYAAVRILDNASANNLAVHWRPNNDYGSSTNTQGNFSPVNVELEALLKPGTLTQAEQINRLNDFRYNLATSGTRPGASWNTSLPTGSPVVEDYNGTSWAAQTRSDFEWVSPYDQFYHQLTRRLDAPDFYDQTHRFNAVSVSDAGGVNYKFIFRNPYAPQPSATGAAATLDDMLFDTLKPPVPRADPLRDNKPYDRFGDIEYWFAENFDYGAAGFSRRALLTGRSPVSNLSVGMNLKALEGDSASATPTPPNANLSGQFNPEADPFMIPRLPGDKYVNKVAPNSAPFGELWRGFLMTMMRREALAVPDGFDGTDNPTRNRMFRTPLRLPSNGMRVDIEPAQVMVLRAALAAVNAEDLRDGDDDITSHRVRLTTTAGQVDVTVFGNEQPVFITEVYTNNDTSLPPPTPPPGNGPPTGPPAEPNPKGYVAIELYNPGTRPITLTGWQLGLITRKAGGPDAYRNMKVYPIMGSETAFGNNAPTIAPNGFLVLENYSANSPTEGGATYARHRPPAVTGAGRFDETNVRYVPNLHEVLGQGGDSTPGRELTLLRPRRADGFYTTGHNAEYVEFAQGAVNLYDLVPVDQFDFTDAGYYSEQAPTAGPYTQTHYTRLSGEDRGWRATYPGRWQTSGREEGVDRVTWNPFNAEQDPWIIGGPAQPVRLGGADGASSYTNGFSPIQLNGSGAVGSNKVGTTTNKFPFGGFARNGDLLAVPFIGAYKMHAVDSTDLRTVLEMNAITRDSSLADDYDGGATGSGPNDGYEQIGRFIPLRALDPAATTTDTYAWAADLFDHFSVMAPQADFTPDVRTARLIPTARNYYAEPLDPDRNFSYRTNIAHPQPARNSFAAGTPSDANGNKEWLIPNEGLININTAPYPVLATVPFTDSFSTNQQIAREIVAYRDGDPVATTPVAAHVFYSLFDLYKVAAFRSAFPTNSNPGAAAGDLTPDDMVSGDYEARMLGLTRVSNILTTRSDGYTCYILLQGWRGAGTTQAELVVQRRLAFIGDRSSATPRVSDFTPTIIPSN